MDKESFENKNASNPCLTQCKAACCRNEFFFGISEGELTLLTAKADLIVNLSSRDVHSDIAGDRHKYASGMYVFSRDDGTHDLFMNGYCPNLNLDYSCSIYEDRPQQCRNYEVGGKNCNQMRKDIGLKPLAMSEKGEARPITLFGKLTAFRKK